MLRHMVHRIDNETLTWNKDIQHFGHTPFINRAHVVKLMLEFEVQISYLFLTSEIVSFSFEISYHFIVTPSWYQYLNYPIAEEHVESIYQIIIGIRKICCSDKLNFSKMFLTNKSCGTNWKYFPISLTFLCFVKTRICIDVFKHIDVLVY